ncbi:MAG: DUF1211 domain-containing protein [Chitinophagaceae bacterium]|nr:DUF1211 domain-containing protein [Chitinophagaceae bacterium]
MRKNKIKERYFPASRLEAFSDGVIAIIITLMILEIKIPELAATVSGKEVWQAFTELLPKLFSYIMSFVVIAIIWINHHPFIHLVKHTNRTLLWMNIHLLFWMSLIPLPTAFLGSHPNLPQATMFYGIIMFMASSAFTVMRWYAQDHADLFHDGTPASFKKFTAVLIWLAHRFTLFPFLPAFSPPKFPLVFLFLQRSCSLCQRRWNQLKITDSSPCSIAGIT